MKKFLLTILMSLIVLTACSTTNYLSRRTVNEISEVSYVLTNYYPQLYEYYIEGVMDIDSMREIILEDGTVDYRIKYHFVRYYYRNQADRMEALQLYFPELYEMYLSGVIEVNSIYKYVEKRTGKIRHHCSYNRVYSYYYRTYPYIGGSHIYYRTRPAPPPPRPRVDPGPRPGHNPPPPGNNNVRPNNPPRDNNRPNTQPNNPPRNDRPNNGRQPSTQPNNPPRTGSSTVNRGSQPSRSSRNSGGSVNRSSGNSGSASRSTGSLGNSSGRRGR